MFYCWLDTLISLVLFISCFRINIAIIIAYKMLHSFSLTEQFLFQHQFHHRHLIIFLEAFHKQTGFQCKISCIQIKIQQMKTQSRHSIYANRNAQILLSNIFFFPTVYVYMLFFLNSLFRVEKKSRA